MPFIPAQNFTLNAPVTLPSNKLSHRTLALRQYPLLYIKLEIKDFYMSLISGVE